ncbi:MAG: ABC transporter permease subunit [Thermoplasmata archaeon]|nr:ABC transporter permease subunit [Thermoplasmata archaeon]
MAINFNNIKTIAKKEFMDNLRNKWVIVLTLIFILLTLAMSFVQGGGGMSSAEITVIGILTISSMLVPIIAIMLGYNTITGEAESGSLLVVLSNPIDRFEVLIGKFVGLGSVLSTSIILGFGIAGIVIMIENSSRVAGYLVFMALTILLGLIYLSLSICFSALLKRSVASLGAGIGLFFWGMIIGTVLMGIYLGTGGTLEGMMTNMPDWIMATMVLISPADMYQTSVMLGFNMTSLGASGFSFDIPSYITLARLMIVYAVWIIVPLAIGFFYLKKRDI